MEDIAGRKIGLWTVVAYSHHEAGRDMWLCRCECGLEKLQQGYILRSELSGGCFKCVQREKARKKRRIGWSRGGSNSSKGNRIPSLKKIPGWSE